MTKRTFLLSILIIVIAYKDANCIDVPLNYPNIPVTYRVIINEVDRPDCPLAADATSPGEVELVVPQGTSGIQLMEAAVARCSNFKFTVSFNDARLGYSVDSINGVSGDIKNSCFWTLSFQPYLATELIISPVGISSYYPSYKSVVQWEYQRFRYDDNKL